MGYITSGNPMVDEMAMLNISGNVVPQMWYSTITRDNGKPHLLAITLLSDIVYWYRPIEVRDELTGRIIGRKKKFKGDMLQKSYQQYADLYGESSRSVKSAIDRLEELGVVKRFFCDLTCENGRVLQNVMFLKLDVEVLSVLTYPQKKVANEVFPESDVGDIEEMSEFEDCEGTLHEVVQNSVGGGTKFCGGSYKTLQGVVQNSVGGGTKFCGGSYKILQEVAQNSVSTGTKFCINTKTITENTTENTYIDSINPIYHHEEIRMMDGEDIGEYYRNIVKRNIDYDSLKQELKFRINELDEIVKIMVDVLVSDGVRIRINQAYYPFSEAKRRMLENNYDTIVYIFRCMRENTSEIHNIRNYLLTALFNAPATMHNKLCADVNHDLVCGGLTKTMGQIVP